MRLVGALLGLLALAGCAGPGAAPVKEKTQPPAKAAVRPAAPTPPPQPPGQHVVQKGDTLYAIAFQNGLDYRDLAFWNNLDSPDVIRVGQILRLTPPDDAAGRARGVETLPLRDAGLASPRPLDDKPLMGSPLPSAETRAKEPPSGETNGAAVSAAKPVAAAAAPKTADAQPAAGVQGWNWPATGALIGGFGEGGGKGIDIAGERRAPVFAAAPGKVVYSGEGLRGYGRMLIVKHADEYLTAYAHNEVLLVKEGDWVKGGQKIAEMGDTDADRVKLHFEVRQYGKPLDPLKYLPERK